MTTDKLQRRNVLWPRKGESHAHPPHPVVRGKRKKPVDPITCNGCKHNLPELGDCRNKEIVNGYWKWPEGDCHEPNA